MPKKDSNLIEVRVDTDHWYPAPKPHEGEMWPSVTTILGVGYPKGIGFFKWLIKHMSWEHACEERDAAADRGTNVHKAVEKMMKNRKVVLTMEEFNLEQWWMIESFFNFCQDHRPKFTKGDVEKRVFDPTLKTAGTLDFNPIIDGERHCIDFKTSDQIQITHKIQSSQYGKMVGADWAGVLKLGAKNDRGYIFEEWRMNSKKAKAYLGGFKAAKTIFHIERPRAAPKVKLVPKTLSLSRL